MAAVLNPSEDSNGSEDSQMTQEFIPSDDGSNVDGYESHKRKGETQENREVAKKPKKVNVGVVDGDPRRASRHRAEPVSQQP